MIKNKKYFYSAILLFCSVMIINLPFPHVNPLGESILLIFNYSIISNNGFQYMGILSILLLFIGLFLLTNSLEKFQGLLVLLAFVITLIGPTFLVSVFQQTVATDIYAVSYDSQASSCQFTMVDETTIQGKCELPFVNYSKNSVQFTIQFYDRFPFKDDIEMMTLMNKNGFHEVTLSGREKKIILFEIEIDVSKMESYISGGNANSVNIIMKSEKSRRVL